MNFPALDKPAPEFKLRNQHNDWVALSDFKGKHNVVVYFYPKAMTPGCTIQACGVRDYANNWPEIDTTVLALSPDAPERLLKFDNKEQLGFTLLSDEDHSVAEQYGVWGEKKFMGRTYDGVHRISFIVDKQGVLRHIMDKVKTKTHNDDIYQWIKANL